MQRSYATDHSFHTLNFSVQTIREKQFTCWSKVQSPFLKSANGRRSACLGRTSSSSRRRKRKNRKSRRLRWRGLNRDSNSIEFKTRAAVHHKWSLSPKYHRQHRRHGKHSGSRWAANLFDWSSRKPGRSIDGIRLGILQRHYSLVEALQTQQKQASFLMFTLLNILLLCYFDVQCL